MKHVCLQRTNTLMSDSPGLVEIAVRPVDLIILHLPNRQVKVIGEFYFWGGKLM